MKRSLAAGLLALASVPLMLIAHACGDAQHGGEAARVATLAAGGANTNAEAAAAPRVRMVLSGFMQGALEPCGCASGQMGGLARRAFYLLQPQHDIDLRLEGGNLIPAADDAHMLGGGTALDREKMATALQVLDMRLHYDAFAIGPNELLLPYDDLALYLGGMQVPVVSSDLQPKEAREDWPAKPWIEKQVREQTVRIASFTGSKPDSGAGPALKLLQTGPAWTRAMQGAAPATYRILLVHGSPQEVRRCAGLEPKPDLIVGIDEIMHEPPEHPEVADGVPIVFPGIRGRMLLDVTLARPASGPLLTRYEVIKLEGSVTVKGALEDRATKDLLLQHREAVAQMDLLEEMADKLPTPSGATYVGNKVCADCHESAAAVWAKTKHAAAWQTLVEAQKDPKRYGWPVTEYPDCVSCHVVGYRRQSGFVNMQRTPDLAAVGCEQCHGPGSEHIKDEKDKSKILRGGAGTCLTCHNFEQSPKFTYGEKWPLIEHK